MAEVNLHLTAHFRRRWWFMPAKIGTIVLIYVGIIRNIDGAARWLIANGTVCEVRTADAA